MVSVKVDFNNLGANSIVDYYLVQNGVGTTGRQIRDLSSFELGFRWNSLTLVHTDVFITVF